MLEGLEISEIQVSDLYFPFRIDAETYRPFYMDIENSVKSKEHRLLGEESSIFKKGIFDINSDKYCESGIPFVRISNLKNMLISDADIIHIPESENDKNLNTFLKKGDIILSKTATPAASYVQLDNCNTSQDTVALKLKKDSNFLSSFIVVFLNSKYGFLQMQRWFTGNVQMHLNLTDSKGIYVPKLTNSFQVKIETVFLASIAQKSISQDKYAQAEKVLLQEIGLDDFKPSTEAVNIKSFSESFGASGRLDAEYYQLKYELIENTIMNHQGGYSYLAKAIVYLRTGEYFSSYNKKDNGNDYYIRNTNISKGAIVPDEEYAVEKSETSFRAKKNEILTSRVGTIGLFGVITEDLVDSGYSDNVLCFRLNEGLNPLVYSVLFSTPPYQLLLEKLAGGSVQPLITQTSLKELILPIIDTSRQKEIAGLIEESFSLKKQSEHLLEVAKQAVEVAIEESEDVAMKWIKKEVKDGN